MIHYSRHRGKAFPSDKKHQPPQTSYRGGESSIPSSPAVVGGTLFLQKDDGTLFLQKDASGPYGVRDDG